MRVLDAFILFYSIKGRIGSKDGLVAMFVLHLQKL